LDLIVQWRPEFIYGGVSLVYTTAKALEERGHTSLGACVVQTHSEKLYDFQREKLQKVFGGEILAHYGSGEIHSLGVECPAHSGIHLFSNLRLFELDPIGDTDNHSGDVLVTDFYNYAMPFLRYRVGDVLAIDHSTCPCGRHLPRTAVEGRTIDIIRLRDGTLVDSTLMEKLMDSKQVKHFLVHQRSFDQIDIHMVPTAHFTEAYTEHLTKEVADKTGIQNIRTLLGDEIDQEVAGKYRLVRSDVSAQMAEQGRVV
jgi:phenylacetate-CoA ligase